MVGEAINIKLTIGEKGPAQKKINVSIANQKSSSSTNKYSGGSSSRVTETYKVGFVAGSSGRAGYKQDSNSKSTHKVNEKLHSGEIKKSSSTYKYSGGSSSGVTKTYKAGFVDGSSGRAGYREEANYKSIHKVNDKVHFGEIRKSSNSTYNYSGGSSSRVIEKAGIFIDERNGREKYREETHYKSTHKVNGKAHSGEIRKSSSTCKYKAGDRRSGREESREEANYKSSYKVNDKAHGVTTEFETSVKYKKTTTYDNSNNYTSVTKY